jgi:hypothetical protein
VEQAKHDGGTQMAMLVVVLMFIVRFNGETDAETQTR